MTPPRITSPAGTAASRFAFGTMQFGGRADEAESAAMYDACRSRGINFFDTAFAYGEGASERILGALAKHERDGLVIATKCAFPGDSKPATIRVQFDQSRRRLGMDMIDILYLHRWDDATPLEDTFGALARFREAGMIRYIGVSNFSAWQTMKASHVAQGLGLGINIIQPMYNLVKRQAEVEILPMSVSEGFNVTPYSPLGGGLLTGKYAAGTGDGRLLRDAAYKARYGVGWMHETARGLAALAAEIGTHPATLAVAWVARNPAVTHPLVSARSLAQIAPSLDAMTFELSDDLFERVSALSHKPPPATDRLEEA
ncbi:MAG: aldo/keto reductase [Paracoccaceae bacterium]